jgi:hypothetical protein
MTHSEYIWLVVCDSVWLVLLVYSIYSSIVSGGSGSFLALAKARASCNPSQAQPSVIQAGSLHD